MVGVGSGSALNAFNIGQQATGTTAIGQAIKSIVDNADKQGLLQAQSGAQTAGSIATAQFKSGLENQGQDVFIPGQGGGLTVIEDVAGGGRNVKSPVSLPGIPANVGQTINKTQPGAGQVQRFNNQGQSISTPPAVNPGGGGAVNLDNIDPNIELTPEQEAELRRIHGLPPR